MTPEFPVQPHHLAFEHLSIPVLVFQERALLYANLAWERMCGTPRAELLGKRVEAILSSTVVESDRGWISEHDFELQMLQAATGDIWVRLAFGGSTERLAHVLVSGGPGKGELTFMLLEAQGEARAQNLIKALAGCSAQMVRCRDEDEVLRIALDVLEQQGFVTGVTFVDGDSMRQGPLRQPAELTRALEQTEHPPREGQRFPRSMLPWIAEVFASGRACFHPDFHQAIAPLFPPDVALLYRTAFPLMRAIHAPIYIGPGVHGLLSAYSGDLNPAQAAAIELFGQHVGCAIENVRHHAEALFRLEQLQRLQAEVIERERLAVLGEAAAVLAHEIKNPLGTILNGVLLLRHEFPAGAPVLQMMEEEANSLDRLTHDMLDYARPFTLHGGEISIVPLFEHALGDVQAHATRQQIPVVVEAPGETLWCDAPLLRLALSNLLRNAVQASPPGARVRLVAELTEGGVLLAVEDEGPGVPVASQARIFEPFFTTRAQGSGLGLALVARVVKLHLGRLQVRNLTPTGARFEIFLPERPRPIPPFPAADLRRRS